MIIRQLIEVPNKLLTQKCAPVAQVDAAAQELAAYLVNMVKTYTITIGEAIPDFKAGFNRIPMSGFAAPQFGELRRIIAVRKDSFDIIPLINPVITKQKGDQYGAERCVSVPKKVYMLHRPDIVKVRYLDINGNERSIKAHGYLARVLCHEIDHLDGILIDDKYFSRNNAYARR